MNDECKSATLASDARRPKLSERSGHKFTRSSAIWQASLHSEQHLCLGVDLGLLASLVCTWMHFEGVIS